MIAEPEPFHTDFGFPADRGTRSLEDMVPANFDPRLCLFKVRCELNIW